MKFNVEKLKEISRPMTQSEREEIDVRNENRDWLALSAKFALLLRHILRTEKMTQTQLAMLMGVSSAQVTKLLSGKENIGLQTIAKVEKALGRSLVSFSNNAPTTVFTPAQQVFTQVLTLPVYSPAEKRTVNAHLQESFSVLSFDKILV